ncbi:hypothetical protein AQUSIP_02630 [Aquicella siphonis]|uniref:Uncharacterized protein n=1 Tax=Aquicella siphonis TaxID=254247 RepID=A0A5E4PDI3_9COXI|nr:hypothetical protein [Aquicella siphonis]VVC74989.1 hypothetical protein AQUSIP_02630 [Aquicella siphonis]
MKFIIKASKYSLLHCYLIIILATIPIASSAQNIVDTSSPQDHLVEPAIVMTPSTVEPDCHTYTGCGLIIVKKYYYNKPKQYKPKQHRIYHQPCCVIGGCYVRPVIGQCW